MKRTRRETEKGMSRTKTEKQKKGIDSIDQDMKQRGIRRTRTVNRERNRNGQDRKQS